MVSDSDEPVALDAALFHEPDGYYEPEKPPTYAEHTLLSGEVLKLRLVGHDPLWVKITRQGKPPRRARLNGSRDTCCGMRDGSCRGIWRRMWIAWSKGRIYWSWGPALGCRVWFAPPEVLGRLVATYLTWRVLGVSGADSRRSW